MDSDALVRLDATVATHAGRAIPFVEPDESTARAVANRHVEHCLWDGRALDGDDMPQLHLPDIFPYHVPRRMQDNVYDIDKVFAAHLDWNALPDILQGPGLGVLPSFAFAHYTNPQKTMGSSHESLRCVRRDGGPMLEDHSFRPLERVPHVHIGRLNAGPFYNMEVTIFFAGSRARITAEQRKTLPSFFVQATQALLESQDPIVRMTAARVEANEEGLEARGRDINNMSSQMNLATTKAWLQTLYTLMEQHDEWHDLVQLSFITAMLVNCKTAVQCDTPEELQTLLDPTGPHRIFSPPALLSTDPHARADEPLPRGFVSVDIATEIHAEPGFADEDEGDSSDAAKQTTFFHTLLHKHGVADLVAELRIPVADNGVVYHTAGSHALQNYSTPRAEMVFIGQAQAEGTDARGADGRHAHRRDGLFLTAHQGGDGASPYDHVGEEGDFEGEGHLDQHHVVGCKLYSTIDNVFMSYASAPFEKLVLSPELTLAIRGRASGDATQSHVAAFKKEFVKHMCRASAGVDQLLNTSIGTRLELHVVIGGGMQNMAVHNLSSIARHIATFMSWTPDEVEHHDLEHLQHEDGVLLVDRPARHPVVVVSARVTHIMYKWMHYTFTRPLFFLANWTGGPEAVPLTQNLLDMCVIALTALKRFFVHGDKRGLHRLMRRNLNARGMPFFAYNPTLANLSARIPVMVGHANETMEQLRRLHKDKLQRVRQPHQRAHSEVIAALDVWDRARKTEREQDPLAYDNLVRFYAGEPLQRGALQLYGQRRRDPAVHQLNEAERGMKRRLLRAAGMEVIKLYISELLRKLNSKAQRVIWSDQRDLNEHRFVALAQQHLTEQQLQDMIRPNIVGQLDGVHAYNPEAVVENIFPPLGEDGEPTVQWRGQHVYYNLHCTLINERTALCSEHELHLVYRELLLQSDDMLLPNHFATSRWIHTLGHFRRSQVKQEHYIEQEAHRRAHQDRRDREVRRAARRERRLVRERQRLGRELLGHVSGPAEDRGDGEGVGEGEDKSEDTTTPPVLVPPVSCKLKQRVIVDSDDDDEEDGKHAGLAPEPPKKKVRFSKSISSSSSSSSSAACAITPRSAGAHGHARTGVAWTAAEETILNCLVRSYSGRRVNWRTVAAHRQLHPDHQDPDKCKSQWKNIQRRLKKRSTTSQRG